MDCVAGTGYLLARSRSTRADQQDAHTLPQARLTAHDEIASTAINRARRLLPDRSLRSSPLPWSIAFMLGIHGCMRFLGCQPHVIGSWAHGRELDRPI